MKLIGNSVSVPVIEMLGKAIKETGVFDENNATVPKIENNFNSKKSSPVLQT